ncbi:MAG: 4Fe-4S dicluster domain-containing protein [Candidatus Bathyarchaeum sp.]|nr:MAG: 4Fe-4S dicluster domain-containing protein [Candidatus Bathyarchaeum sp.]
MVLHAKRYSLTLDKNKCTGCGICMEICPREAIEVTKTPKIEGEAAKPPTVAISEEKCTYCGMCETLCAFGALSIKINGEHIIPVVNSESFPQLIREITVDETKCGVECAEIEDACPLDLIKVSVHTPDGKEITGANSRLNKENLEVTVNIDKDSCPCCQLCETKFPDSAIRVEKIFHGNLRINREKCPEDCHDCLDVCPIPGVLYLLDDGKVHVNELNCIYCGVCRIVCPEEGALELNRTRIRHTEVRSGAWNKALEKLASTKAMTKELKTKSGKRLYESMKSRFPPEVENDV